MCAWEGGREALSSCGTGGVTCVAPAHCQVLPSRRERSSLEGKAFCAGHCKRAEPLLVRHRPASSASHRCRSTAFVALLRPRLRLLQLWSKPAASESLTTRCQHLCHAAFPVLLGASLAWCLPRTAGFAMWVSAQHHISAACPSVNMQAYAAPTGKHDQCSTAGR